jgi:alanine dehydrogenase
VADADLVVGAVLVAGGRAPVVITEEMVRGMQRGSVVVDVAIDQGGCVEGITETTHDDPVYERHGVIHYAVGNIPAAVPHTSTYALTNVTLPYVAAVAERGVRAAAGADPTLVPGVTTVGGRVTNPAVAESLGLPFADPLAALA